MKEVVIVSAVRTPFGKLGGILKDMNIIDLGASVIKEVIKRVGIDSADIDEVYMGKNMPDSERSIARQVALKAGLPETVNATTVDRACCSSTAALAMAYRAIKADEAGIVVAGGVENMSQTPYFVKDLRWGKRLGDIVLNDLLIVKCPYTGVARAVQAGNEAVEHDIGREEQDKWALRSQKRYAEALKNGKFKEEIVSIKIKGNRGEITTVDQDEGPRPDTTLQKLAGLPNVYDSPTVTAGNAPGLSTGASALLVMSKQKADELGIKPFATILSHVQGSGHPQKIASIPAVTARRALEKANMSVDQMDLIEINEAFAAMPLVSSKILGDNNPIKIKKIRDKTNVNGGAIAIGHPTGATGGRLVMTLIYELRRSGKKYGLVTICGGIAEGESFVLQT